MRPCTDSQAVDPLLMQGQYRGWCPGAPGDANRSEATEAKLRARNLGSHIHRKGRRGKPLTEQAKGSNRTRSTVRVRVEHVFGAQANDMGGALVRTIGMVRAKAKIGMKNLACNEEDQELIRGINSPTNAPSWPVAPPEPVSGVTSAHGNQAARSEKKHFKGGTPRTLGRATAESADITRVKRLSALRASRNDQKSRRPMIIGDNHDVW
jgi:hypothetical protein